MSSGLAPQRLVPTPILFLLVAGLVHAGPASASTRFSSERVILSGTVGADEAIGDDLDRDGDIDVVAAIPGTNTVAWYENVGTASFAAHQISAAADGAHGVAVADLDADGDRDVISASGDDDTVAWYENNGAQSFTERTITATADGAKRVAVADLDRDGDVDVLAAAVIEGAVLWFENDGGGSFVEHAVAAGVSTAQSVDASDVDDDGDLDVVVATSANSRILWFENDGSEVFSQHVILSAAGAALDALAVDLDGDGHCDALGASSATDTVAWFENNGAEVFTRHPITTVADGVVSVDVGDLDGNGDLDVLSASLSDSTVAWYENDGSEGFTERDLSTTANDPQGVFATDLDGDGDLDVLTVSRNDINAGTMIGWFENLRPLPRSAALPEAIAVDGAAPAAVTIDAGDLDGDGDPDLVAGAFNEDRIAWCRNGGDGTFTELPLAAGVAELVDGVNSVELRDLDRDGDLDVLSAAVMGNAVGWHENVGGTPPTFAHHLVDGEATGVRWTTAGDLDRDGDLDIVAAVTGSSLVLWYANDGAGSFSGGMLVLGTATGVRTVDLGDLDRDGDLDIALARSNATQIEWMENEGGTPPGFTLRSPPDAFPAPFAVRVADFDGDGRNDLLATSLTNDKVAWFRNLGGGPAAFVLASVRSNVPDATNLETTDVDGDGDEDFLVAATLADRVFWFENLGPGTFPRARVLPPLVDGVLGVVAADLDGDGTVDLAVANAAGNTVARLPNRPALFWDDFEVGSTAIWAGRFPP